MARTDANPPMPDFPGAYVLTEIATSTYGRPLVKKG